MELRNTEDVNGENGDKEKKGAYAGPAQWKPLHKACRRITVVSVCTTSIHSVTLTAEQNFDACDDGCRHTVPLAHPNSFYVAQNQNEKSSVCESPM